MHKTEVKNPLTYVNTNENPNALAFLTNDNLTDEQWVDAFRTFVQLAIDEIIDRLLPPEKIEQRLAELKASIARAERDSNPRPAGSYRLPSRRRRVRS